MEKAVNFYNKLNRWHKVGVIFLIVELRLIPTGQYGFTCNDPALSFPFNGDTITWKWLLSTVVLFPLVFLLFAERLKQNNEHWKQKALQLYKEYIFGVLLNLVIIGSLKIVVSSPRPHFFDTCQPKEATSCVGSEFVSSYTCTKSHWVNQSDKSFPSGHASLGVHTAVFLAYYLKKRFNYQNLLVLVMQIVLILAGIFCGASRILDRRHHWWDVLAGSVLALPILYYTIIILCDDFKCHPKSASERPVSDTSVNSN